MSKKIYARVLIETAENGDVRYRPQISSNGVNFKTIGYVGTPISQAFKTPFYTKEEAWDEIKKYVRWRIFDVLKTEHTEVKEFNLEEDAEWLYLSPGKADGS